MVIFQDTVAHSLPARNILRRLDIVRMIRYLSDEYDTGLLVPRIIGNPVPFDPIPMVLQFPDRFFIQTAAGFMPELNGRIKFFDIIIPEFGS